jgi:hypothetical protein
MFLHLTPKYCSISRRPPSGSARSPGTAVEIIMGWQPTMQVLYGERDLFDPSYLSDAMLTRVVPASALEWYRSLEGQWFRDVLAPILLPKLVLESHDPSAQWSSARSFMAAPIARNANATRYMAAHDARFLFGTDTPSAPTYANPPGLNGWLEMHRLIDAGLTPAQVFRAPTLSNVEALGLSREIGTVLPGMRANLLLLREGPTQTIQAYDQIVKVILHGKVLDRGELAANRAASSVPSSRSLAPEQAIAVKREPEIR